MRRLLVIDDHERFSELIRSTMGTEPDFDAVGHATNVADGLDMIRTLEPDLVMVNVHVGPRDGIADITRIAQRHPNVRVIALTAFVSASMLERVAAADARALHPKDAGLARLLWLLRNTGDEGFIVHPESSAPCVDRWPAGPAAGGRRTGAAFLDVSGDEWSPTRFDVAGASISRSWTCEGEGRPVPMSTCWEEIVSALGPRPCPRVRGVRWSSHRWGSQPRGGWLTFETPLASRRGTETRAALAADDHAKPKRATKQALGI
jgi:CheY-like chemotaxis protein